MKKDLTGKIVFGFGGFTDMTPCIYRDNGWYDGTIKEYNVRKVEQVKLLDELRSDHPLVSAASASESYGCRWGGGFSSLYEISEEHVQELLVENNRLAEVKRQKEAEEKAAWEEEVKRRELYRKSLKASLKCEILASSGEDDVDSSALVRMTDLETGESLEFNCRNVFDVGYVINPNFSIAPGIKGGININNSWHNFDANKGGWYSVRGLTDFERFCLKYLQEFPPVYNGIRM